MVRPGWIAVALLALTLAAAPAVLAQRAETAAADAVVTLEELRGPLLRTINATRRSHGLKPLGSATGLDRAARAHARSMAQIGYFSHTSQDGTAAAERIRRFYGGSSLGETLLWRAPGITAQQAVEMWLTSPPHREILLSASYDEIGLIAVHVDDAPGVYRGYDVTIVVADFGAR